MDFCYAFTGILWRMRSKLFDDEMNELLDDGLIQEKRHFDMQVVCSLPRSILLILTKLKSFTDKFIRSFLLSENT